MFSLVSLGGRRRWYDAFIEMMERREVIGSGTQEIQQLLFSPIHDKKMFMNGIKEKLHAMAPAIFEKTPVLFAYLYGSYAKGLSHPFSDLDVGVYVEGLDKRSCLDLELSLALHIDEKLDHAVQSEVRVLNHLPLAVKGRILADGELIYSRDEMNRIDFETKVRSAYFDFLPVIHAYQQAYIERVLSVQGHDIR